MSQGRLWGDKSGGEMKKLKKIGSAEIPLYSYINGKASDIRYGEIPIEEIKLEVIFPSGVVAVGPEGKITDLLNSNYLLNNN